MRTGTEFMSYAYGANHFIKEIFWVTSRVKPYTVDWKTPGCANCIPVSETNWRGSLRSPLT